MVTWMASCAKAIVAAIAAGYGLYQTATTAISPGMEHVTSDEWVGIAVMIIFTFTAVWAIPNTPKKEDTSTQVPNITNQ